MKKFPLLWVFYSLCFICLCMQSCKGQNAEKGNTVQPKNQSGKIVGGMCDGCEIMYEGMPDLINDTDTSDGWNEAGTKTDSVRHRFSIGWQNTCTGHYTVLLANG